MTRTEIERAVVRATGETRAQFAAMASLWFQRSPIFRPIPRSSSIALVAAPVLIPRAPRQEFSNSSSAVTAMPCIRLPSTKSMSPMAPMRDVPPVPEI